MKNMYLLKLGELTLKSGNREEFERCLKDNLRRMLKPAGGRVSTRNGRFFVRCLPEKAAETEDVLSRTIGITGWAKSREANKVPQAIFAACVEEARELAARGAKTFKIEARRADKSFPLDSYGIMREAGGAVLQEVPQLTVDVRKPDGVIEVEIREKAYVYAAERPGLRGLPVGTEGRAMLLLSGGIDSPVAGYLMAKRGMRLAAVYFHAYPYTSKEAKDKVATLAERLSRYSLGLRLTTIPFTAVQLRIKEKAPAAWTTVLSRMAMMEVAERLARVLKARCLVTGESLGQVASQTIENMECTASRAQMPVLRPLIAVDKQDTVRMAKEIGTYETSILPYADCCVIFSPKHPILRAPLAEATALYESLELGPLLEEAFAGREFERFGYY